MGPFTFCDQKTGAPRSFSAGLIRLRLNVAGKKTGSGAVPGTKNPAPGRSREQKTRLRGGPGNNRPRRRRRAAVIFAIVGPGENPPWIVQRTAFPPSPPPAIRRDGPIRPAIRRSAPAPLLSPSYAVWRRSSSAWCGANPDVQAHPGRLRLVVEPPQGADAALLPSLGWMARARWAAMAVLQ